MYPAGSIHWLLPRDRIPSEHLLAAQEVDEGCYNHPVLILAVDATFTEAAVLIVRHTIADYHELYLTVL
jgi:hypothetical protein